ncbi:MAG: AI-2E family transporter [bacterium]
MNEPRESPLFTWKRIWLILILLAGLWVLVSARAALGPLVAAFILAYLLNPIVEILERRGVPRTAAVALLLLGVGVLIALLWASLAPIVEKQIVAFARRVPAYARVVEGWLETTLARFEIVPPEEIRKYITENLVLLGRLPLQALSAGGKVLLQTTKGLFSLIVGIAYLALIPVMTFYILRDMNRITEAFYRFIHPDYREEVQLRLHRLDEVMGSFIKGQLIVGLLLSSLYILGFYMADMPLWLVLGIFTGLVSIFPYVEWIVALPVALALAALQHQDWLHPLAVLAVFGVISPAGGMFIVPRVLGGRVGLHPVVIIASIIIGAELLGFLGILLAVPMAAVIKVGLEAVHDYYIA